LALPSTSASPGATINRTALTPFAAKSALAGASCWWKWPPAPARPAPPSRSSSACSQPASSLACCFWWIASRSRYKPRMHSPPI
jgi:hypothetical protein